MRYKLHAAGLFKGLSMSDLSEKQRWAIHFFDERGNSVISQLHIIAENRRLEAENAKLKRLLAKVTQDRADTQRKLSGI